MTGSGPAPIAPAHITVFGAGGRTGRALMQAAHRAGIATTAHARQPDRLATTPADRVTVGSVLGPASVAEALEGADATILAVGLGPDRRTPLFTTGTRIVVETVRQQRVPRLIVISEAAYRPHTAGLLPRLAAATYRLAAAEAIRQRGQQDLLVRTSGLDWTTIRPVRVVDQPARGLRADIRRPRESSPPPPTPTSPT